MRNPDHKEYLYDKLYQHCAFADLLVQGGANGADLISNHWAKERGIHTAQIDALWNRFMNSAGPMRNHVMCDAFPYATVLAFPLSGSIGTWECVRYARSNNMKTIVEKDHNF